MSAQSSAAVQSTAESTEPTPSPLDSGGQAYAIRQARTSRSRQGEAALAAVRWGILERVGRCGWLRVETIPATWPMTRHLVRRMTEQLVADGLLELLPNASVRLTPAGATVREAERRRRGE